MGKSLKDRVDDWIHRSYMYPIAHSLEAILLTQRDEVYSMEKALETWPSYFSHFG